ncbi:hypothetical protein [Bradyrhizobium betae]|uniref:hypothetical protein n=1 Tax=Bradyrhizobium betae TaxID=244734 RepID=UPI00100DBCF0|nr:hypothetical protein [Bradyrhizobium betae]
MSWDFVTKALGFFVTYPAWARVSMLVSALVFLASLFLGYQAAKLKVSINKPEPGDGVPWAFPVEATVENLPEGPRPLDNDDGWGALLAPRANVSARRQSLARQCYWNRRQDRYSPHVRRIFGWP